VALLLLLLLLLLLPPAVAASGCVCVYVCVVTFIQVT
jgi:hypothetical protein